jgi:hypothetical protein
MPNRRRHAIPHLPQPLLGRRVRAAHPGARALQQALRARPVAEARKGSCELPLGSMRLGRLASSITGRSATALAKSRSGVGRIQLIGTREANRLAARRVALGQNRPQVRLRGASRVSRVR